MLDVLLAELLGTFIFLSVIILSIHSTNDAKNSIAWIKIGLALSISILLVGFISGGQLNPAVSLMLYLNGDVNFNKMIVSIIGQLIGAFCAYYYYRYTSTHYTT